MGLQSNMLLRVGFIKPFKAERGQRGRKIRLAEGYFIR